MMTHQHPIRWSLVSMAWLLLVVMILAFFTALSTAVSEDGNLIVLPMILQPPAWSIGDVSVVTDGLDLPFWHAWLGYDELGRSVSVRLLIGLQTASSIAVVVVFISMLIGTTIGVLAGYLGGWLDVICMRTIDVFLAFPGLLLAILLSALLGPGIENIIIALSLVGWVGFARISRSQVLSLRSRDFISAAQSQGVGTMVILWRHIIPMVLSVILVEATFAFAAAILAEAGLSFLGLGVQPPDPSWGQMIRTGAQYLLVAPHLVMAPGVMLWFSVLAISVVGEKLNQRFNPEQGNGYLR